jgi:hypothetical protein
MQWRSSVCAKGPRLKLLRQEDPKFAEIHQLRHFVILVHGPLIDLGPWLKYLRHW